MSATKMNGNRPLPLESVPLPAPLLKLLFDRLHIPVQAGALNHACAQTGPTDAALSPVKRIAEIFNQLQIKGMQFALLRFARFDLRRMPVLIFHQNEWQLLERENSQMRVTKAGKAPSAVSEEALREAMVLWISRPPQSDQVGSFARHNPARNLVWRELFRSNRWLFDVVIATVMINALAIATSVFAMQVYDRVVPTMAYATLWTLVAGMALVLSLDWLLKTVRARILDSLSCAVDKAISQTVFEHVMKLRLDIRPRSLGTLAAQVGGLDQVRQFFSSGVIFALVDMPFALMFIGFIFIIGGHVGWVYVTLLPVAAGFGFVSRLLMRRLVRQQMVRSNERQGLLVDVIRGTESIRASNASWRFAENWKSITQSIAGYNVKQKAISNLTTVTTGSLSSAAYVCAVVVGVSRIQAGDLTMGGLIACSILGGRVIAPIAQSVQYLVQWQNVSQALRMVNQILMLDTERRQDQSLLMPERPPKEIALEGVRFAYPHSPVKQLNVPRLRFFAGERVALLGPVGSGKSTLLKVMAGLYKPGEGRVCLEHADLWEVDPGIVADRIGYLPQAVHLFKGTLHSNLVLSGAASDSDLLKVCHDLGIERIAAANPRGFDLEISEGGEGLSGGQRQMVGLARIFLARPTIWLLDEPSSSLDGDAENQVFKAIQTYVRPDDILLMATHKPMLAARLATRMIVMQQGEIAIDGPPEAVLTKMRNHPRQPSTEYSRPFISRRQRPLVIGNGQKGPLNVI